MRNAALLGTRLVLGSYLAVHGAQKLFGVFGGAGLERPGPDSTGSACARASSEPAPPGLLSA